MATPSENGAQSPAREIAWRVSQRRGWNYGYENGEERFGEALKEIREELGFDGDSAYDDLSLWMYEEGQRRCGSSTDLSVPPVLIEAFEFPALGWETSMLVIENLAQVIGVSPGTLLDELWLRASRCDEHGKEDDDE